MASIHSDKQNEAVMKIVKTTSYLAAESDGKGNWKWNDGSKWWQPASNKHDGLQGKGETRIAMVTDKRWHDWGTGSATLGAICARAPTSGMCSVT